MGTLTASSAFTNQPPDPFAKPVNELVGGDGAGIGAACGHRIARDGYLGRRRLVDVPPPVDAVMEDRPM